MDQASPRLQFEYESVLIGRRIRLLQIDPGIQDAQLCLRLSEFDLDEVPPFIALSYAWGDPNARRTALCNDSPLAITESLYGVLWQLREEVHGEHFWADAVCINQADVAERTSQVRFMGQIYTAAQMVLIWLGPEEPGDQAGLDLMGAICHAFSFGNLDDPESVAQLFTDLRQVERERWKALISVLRKPWFWRIWIVQEFLKSKECIFRCGKMFISPVLFSIFSTLMYHYPELKTQMQLYGQQGHHDSEGMLIGPFFATQLLFGLESASEKRFPLQHLQSNLRGFQSSDPRDRVFALVGLSSDTDVEIIDYSVDLIDLLTNLNSRHIRKLLSGGDSSPVFEYLCYVDHRVIDGLPSWVPSFESSSAIYKMSSIFQTTKSMETTAEIHLSKDNVLELRGRIVDRIEVIVTHDITSKAMTGVTEDINEGILDFSQRLVDFIADTRRLITSRQPSPTKEDPVDVLWKTLMFDTGDLQSRARCSPELRKAFEAYFERWVINRSYLQMEIQIEQPNLPLPSQGEVLEELQTCVPSLKWTPSDFGPARNVDSAFLDQMWSYIIQEKELIWSFQASLVKFCPGRRFFASQAGYGGWIPWHALEGDQICAFNGSRYPFVVRPHGDGKSWKLVGACFMHGLMEGDATQLPTLSGEYGETIRLV